jgi:glycosyltransferase involved in cell wall biosynthesis
VAEIYLRTRFDRIPLHSLYNDLLANPPSGITISKSQKSTNAYYKFDRKSANAVRQVILYYTKTWPYLLNEWLSQRHLPTNPDLIYASQHVIFSEMRWITDFEFANAFVAYGNIGAARVILQKRFSSNACKKIMAWTEWAADTLRKSIDTHDFDDKIDVVRFSVPPQPKEVLNKPDEKIRILFIGSNNPANTQNFLFKGGYEAVDASIKLIAKYDNLEIVVKSLVPEEIKGKCSEYGAIKIIDHDLPPAEVKKLYTDSHIFIRAGHEALGPAILEAMSYGLVVVANNIYNVPEAVEDEHTGLLTKTPPVDYYTKYGTPKDYNSKFVNGIRESKGFLAFQIYEKVSRLIEDSALRRKLGTNAHTMIENGKFSSKERNAKLKSIIEVALRK